jgi:UDP-glucose 4-epimerase
MGSKTILVTGGAGYIGSHVALKLGEANERVIVLDNLSTGFRSAVSNAELIVGNTGDTQLVTQILQDNDIDTILHFAAHIKVPESVANPLKYYQNNTCASRNLIECAADAGVRNFVFSSTAAVYGVPPTGIAAEDSPTSPINPYGSSKLMTEWMLRDVSEISGMNFVALRYFNVAGCDSGGRIGLSDTTSTLLTKVAGEAALGKRAKIFIFGTDYPTPDGTALRDYVHIEDLADAHLAALDYLKDGGESTTLNCGYGHGYSVREVLAAVEQAHGAPLPVEEAPRRAGDPPILIAGADRIQDVLNWKPQFDDLNLIVSSQLNWEKRLLASPELLDNQAG